MGVAQKTMFSISDHQVNIFGISGAPMEHNAIAKSKETFLFNLFYNISKMVFNKMVFNRAKKLMVQLQVQYFRKVK